MTEQATSGEWIMLCMAACETHGLTADDLRRAINEPERYTLAVVDVAPANPFASRNTKTRQYYYHASNCLAADADDPICICWRDEGTGPLADRPQQAKHWRDKPDDIDGDKGKPPSDYLTHEEITQAVETAAFSAKSRASTYAGGAALETLANILREASDD